MLRVKEICKKQGVTQKELAEKMGVSQSAFTQIVNGNPTLNKIVEISQILDCAVHELIDEKVTTGFVCPNCGATLELKVKEIEK